MRQSSGGLAAPACESVFLSFFSARVLFGCSVVREREHTHRSMSVCESILANTRRSAEEISEDRFFSVIHSVHVLRPLSRSCADGKIFISIDASALAYAPVDLALMCVHASCTIAHIASSLTFTR